MSGSTKDYPPSWTTKENKLEGNTPGKITLISKEEFQNLTENKEVIKENQGNRVCQTCKYKDANVNKGSLDYDADAGCSLCIGFPDRPRWVQFSASSVVNKCGSNPGMTGQYTFRGGIEPLDFIKSNKMGFAEGNVVKYLYRYPFKHGIRDLEKARFYIDLLIKEHVA